MKYIASGLFVAMLTTSAHAFDAWTQEHLRQFKAKTAGMPYGPGYRAEYKKFCQEGFMHDYDIGVFDAVSTAQRLENCNKW